MFRLIDILMAATITGAIATVAVPSYEVAKQQAKQIEAKLALGAIYKVEIGFQAEHNAYGSNLKKVGIKLEGEEEDRVYTVGFPTASCSDSSIKPEISSNNGTRLNLVFPGYYQSPSMVLKKEGQTSCVPGEMDAEGTSYLATATGAIAPDVPVNAPLNQLDVWTINHNRQLINTQSGIVDPE